MVFVTLDFETYYTKDYSLSKMSTEAYIRDPRFEIIGVSVKINDGPTNWYTSSSDIAALKHTIDWKNAYVLCHNTAFDGAILAWILGIKPRFYLDTLSMARPLTQATVGGSLANLAKYFQLGIKGDGAVKALGKRKTDFTARELAEYGEYCKNDTELTYELFKKLRPHSTERELFVIDLMLRMFIDPVLVLDYEILQDHLAKVQARKVELMAKLEADRSQLMSQDKFALLLESYGVEVPMKTNKKGHQTFAFAKTDQGFKDLLEHENPEVQAICAARLGIKSTLEETRTRAFMDISKRGTLAILLNYYGAHTGRASGGDKINLQNLPRGGALRRAMTAPPGHILVAGDSSQIEARVVAWWAGQDDLVQDFRDGVDIYSKFASDVYGRPINRKYKAPDGSTPDFLPGFVGKTCILGLGFGMGPPKLRNTLKVGQGGVSVDLVIGECERIVYDVYRRKYQKIKQLWWSCQNAMEKVAQGFTQEIGVNLKLVWDADGIHLPNGMLIRYTNLRQEGDQYVYDTRRGPTKLYGGKIVENVVQALARIVVFNQMCAVSQQLRDMDDPQNGRRFMTSLTVHDEIVVVVPDAWQGAAVKLLEERMSRAPQWAPDLPIACEVHAGSCYADCK